MRVLLRGDGSSPDCDSNHTLKESLDRIFAPLCNSSLFVTPECNLFSAVSCASSTARCLAIYPNDPCYCQQYGQECFNLSKCLGTEMATIAGFQCEMFHCGELNRTVVTPLGVCLFGRADGVVLIFFSFRHPPLQDCAVPVPGHDRAAWLC